VKKKRTKRTEITVETDEFIFSRAVRGPVTAWCARCGARVRMVSPEEAARIVGVTPRTIYRWVDAASIHFVEEDSHVLVCLPALSIHASAPDTSGPPKSFGRRS